MHVTMYETGERVAPFVAIYFICYHLFVTLVSTAVGSRVGDPRGHKVTSVRGPKGHAKGFHCAAGYNLHVWTDCVAGIK